MLSQQLTHRFATRYAKLQICSSNAKYLTFAAGTVIYSYKCANTERKMAALEEGGSLLQKPSS